MAYTQTLSGLSVREQIADILVRACLALDTNDKALWKSAWADDKDISFTVRNNATTGLTDINKYCLDTIGPMNTQHFLTTIRVHVKDGANTAHITSNSLNQHFHAGEAHVPGAEHLLAGTVNDIQVVKDTKGQWKMIIGNEGSWTVMHH